MRPRLNRYRRDKRFPDFFASPESIWTARSSSSRPLSTAAMNSKAALPSMLPRPRVEAPTTASHPRGGDHRLRQPPRREAYRHRHLHRSHRGDAHLRKILKAHELESFTVLCKVGSVDKCDAGIPDSLKVKPGSFEAICNSVLQAELLNQEKTDLNVIVGLCVVHDFFIRHLRSCRSPRSSPRIA